MKPEKFHSIAIKLTLLCIFVFLLETLYPQFFLNNFVLNSSEILVKPWMIFTHIFLHGSLKHLFFNMFGLVLFGSILEKIIGYKNFLIVFFLSGIVSGVGSILFYESSLGASGAIFGVLGVLGIIRPRLVVWVWGVPMYIILALLFWGVLDLIGIFSPDQVAHAAHLFGLIFGGIIGLKLRGKYKLVGKKKEEEFKISEEEFKKWEDKYMRR